jgi:hemerythrin-like metal-binding protein
MDPTSRSPFGRMSGLHGLSDLSLKQLVSWGDHLKVDQPQIDAQHQAIFDIALEIADLWHKHGDLDQVKALAEKLDKVLEAHFRFEEQQLASIGYTKLAEHRGEHKVMLDELHVIRGRLAKMGHGTIQAEPGFLVLSYILGVTVGHITHSDMDYCAFAHSAAGNGGQAWPAL